MKKLVLSLTFTIVAAFAVAQCTPNTSYTQPGNYPAVLDVAWVDSSYSMTVTNVVPLDTTVILFGFIPVDVVVDSVVIQSINGIPQGYSTACSPSNCVYLGGTKGCFKISGTTSNPSMVGIYPLRVITKTYAKLKASGAAQAPQIDTVKSYSLEIKKAIPSGIETVLASEGVVMFPNPTNGAITVRATLKDAVMADVVVYSILGKVVSAERVTVSNGMLNNTIDLSGKQAGLYFVEIRTDKQRISRKISLK